MSNGAKIAQRIIGAVLVLGGSLWMLQGMGIATGSPMTGQSRWIYIGGLVVIGGVLLIRRTWRARE